MAKNWTVAEAVQAILQNDKNGIADFGKRFPQATNVLTRIAAMNTDGGAALQELANAIPERVTVRKIDAVLKDGVEPVEDEDADDTEEEAPKAKRGRTAKTDEEKKAAAKARREARKAKKAKVEEPEDDEDEGEAEDDYSGMNAVDLFKLCKKRGIKAAPKMKAAEYIKLLKAADAKVADDADEDEEDDEWEEVPVEKPKAKRGRPAKKKEPEPEVEEDEDDEDDDWDL